MPARATGRPPAPPTFRRRRSDAVATLLAMLVASCDSAVAAPPPGKVRNAGAPYLDATAPIPARVADLLARMTLDEKIGQMTQVDRAYLASPADIAAYGLGSLLSGGGSAPATNTAQAWADMVDGYQRIALSSRLGIPILYGIDAVHGHNNVYGATIFPHNVGLGAARDPELVGEIARATAEEVAGTGITWDFAPCVAVARNERWGRTYESFGELPEIAASYGTYVTGLQGELLGAAPASILATAKHWVADGGTSGGVDEGNSVMDEATLRATHVPPYLEAIRRGVGAVMVSYSSWNGLKMHANPYLVTDVLKGELGFGGIVVSDWKAVNQLSPDYATAVRTAIDAGLDMVMVPDAYRTFIATLRAEVDAGRVPLARIDDAVTRILTKKFELGLFERPFADRGFTASVGSPAHRAIARRAVRESLVLLKNEGVLPLPRTARIFVAGKSADDLGNQAGGWTLSWQGASGDTIPGTTILDGIRSAVDPGTAVAYDRGAAGLDGSYDVAVVVVGETPYAETAGDRPGSLGLDAEDLATLAAVKASGVPAVVVLVSGRPLMVTDLLPDWSALVAAWLPGSEGAGVADVLFGDAKPTGRLPTTWPRSEAQIPMNAGDAVYDPLFPYGFGLTYP